MILPTGSEYLTPGLLLREEATSFRYLIVKEQPGRIPEGFTTT